MYKFGNHYYDYIPSGRVLQVHQWLDYYQSLRLTHGVQESLRLTAEHFKKPIDEVGKALEIDGY
jgi:hypothetical protein